MDELGSFFCLPVTLLVLLGVLGCAFQSPSAPKPLDTSHTGSIHLLRLGETGAFEGTVIRSPGWIAVRDREGLIRHPFKAEPVPGQTGGQPVVSSPEDCPDPPRKPQPGFDTVIWVVASGAVGPLDSADVEILVGPPPGSHPLDIQLAPMQLRIRTDSKVVAKISLEWDGVPCRILLDDLTGGPEQEIALIWMSLGGSGYTTGLTVYSVRSAENGL